MCLRVCRPVICLFVVIFGVGVSAEEPQSASSPLWITLCQATSNDSQTPNLDLQVPSGIDFKVVDAIAETLSHREIYIARLISRQNVRMEFSNSSFLVMKIDGEDLTLAPGSDFPFDATRTLATQLNDLGVQNTTIVEPDELLQRRLSRGDPFVPKFAYDLPGQSASQGGNPFAR